jgi:hypothetical protein
MGNMPISNDEIDYKNCKDLISQLELTTTRLENLFDRTHSATMSRKDIAEKLEDVDEAKRILDEACEGLKR